MLAVLAVRRPAGRVLCLVGRPAASWPRYFSSSDESFPFDKVLIANRGEIAVRIARACKELGLKTAGIYAKEDAGSLHVLKVDEAIQVTSETKGPIAPYLDVASVIAAAKSCGAGAIHPGYGFLSESADLSAACAAEGIKFVGPKAEILRMLGDKVAARDLASRSNVPILRGSPELESAEHAKNYMKEHGISLPIIFKASYGGGGRGMRLVEKEADIAKLFQACTGEAKTAFGNGAVFFEEFMTHARHIEVQILSDGKGGVKHLFERDCSVQIRNQKVVETAPSRMHPGLRKKITDCAVSLIGNCEYQGVATVEFMVGGDLDSPDVHFIFMEVNPRVQVEHTITEEITGVDIVKSQLRIAAGRSLPEIGLPGGEGHAASTIKGCAIQSRVSLRPPPGTVSVYREPAMEGVRIDAALYEGCKPAVFYDPLVGKLICFAPGTDGEVAFQAARQLSLKALEEWDIQGVTTNKPLMRGILTHQEFIDNQVYLNFMARHGASLEKGSAAPTTEAATTNRGPGVKKELMVGAPLDATVIAVIVKEGDEVKQGDTLLKLSAMKLESEVEAPADGVVTKISVGDSENVTSGQELVVLDAVVYETVSAGASGPEATRRRATLGGSVDASAMWYGPSEGVAPCEGPSSTSLRLPAIKRDDAFDLRQTHHADLLQTLNKRLDTVRAGGSERAIDLNRKRGKMLPRERIEAIIDPGTKFLEICPLAAWDMYGGGVSSASIVTGIGLVHGKEVLFVANDSTVKGGTYYPMTIKKHLRAQELAAQNKLTCVYLVDSGGAFLPMQDQVFPDKEHFGRIFFNQATMSQQGLPQVSVVCGLCTAGGAYIPAMSDENVLVKGNGTIFLAGPPLVKAATGEVVSAEDLGGADVHTRISGVSDHFAEDEPHGLRICRDILAYTGDPAPCAAPELEPEEPLYDPQELLGLFPEDNAKAVDIKQVVARVVDGSRFHEYKARYGPQLVCGFAHVHGYPVGIVANNGILFGECAQKGANFIQICGQRKIPLLFLQNITGFMVGSGAEHGGIAKHGAKLVTAVSTVDVPKITILVGGSHGAGNYGMCGRAFNPRFLFMWPNSKISVMGGQQAADVLATVNNDARQKKGQAPLTGADLEEFRSPTIKKYEQESSAYYSTARLWDDGIIDPRDTRHVVARCLRICSRNPGQGAQSYGIFRM